MKNSIKNWPLPIKLLAIFGMITIPLIVIMVLFSPLVAQKQKKIYSQVYPISENFTQEDIRSTIGKMEKDGEFFFYFMVLTDQDKEMAAEEVFQILSRNRGKDKHYRQIMESMKEAKSLATLFGTLVYPEKFHAEPEQYPVLGRTLHTFVYEEFKLTVMGLCYRSMYDKNFRFQWDETSQEAATKLQKLILQLRESKQIGRWRESL